MRAADEFDRGPRLFPYQLCRATSKDEDRALVRQCSLEPIGGFARLDASIDIGTGEEIGPVFVHGPLLEPEES